MEVSDKSRTSRLEHRLRCFARRSSMPVAERESVSTRGVGLVSEGKRRDQSALWKDRPDISTTFTTPKHTHELLSPSAKGEIVTDLTLPQ